MRHERLAYVLVLGLFQVTTGVAREVPPPDGPWRPHRLSRCAAPLATDPTVGESLRLAADLHEQGSGGDAVAALEACLREHAEAPEVLLTLGQLYLLAALGGEAVVPREGPAARTGERDRDRVAWLERSATLLAAAGAQQPDDGMIDYLLAEVDRGRGNLEVAMATELRGMRKCSYAGSIEMVRRYQRVQIHAAQVTSPITPQYPEAARQKKRQGRVFLDLLLDPEARVAQVEIVDGDPVLAAAAAAAAPDAGYQAARVGLYPVWAWLRVTVDFRIRRSGQRRTAS